MFTLSRVYILFIASIIFNIFIFQCFFCDTELSFRDLIQQLQNKVNRDGHAMFEIYEKPLEANLTNLEPVDGFNSSDDEFEIL